MEVEYVLLPDDVLALQEYAWKHPTKQMKDISRGIWLILALLALWSLLTIPSFLRGDWSSATELPLVLFGAVLCSKLFWRPLARRRVRRNLAEKTDKNSRELGWWRMTLTPEALVDTTERDSRTLNWSAVEEIVITGKRALIFDSPTSAFVVPRRAFADENAFREFVETARAYRDMARQAGKERKKGRSRAREEPDTNITQGERAND